MDRRVFCSSLLGAAFGRRLLPATTSRPEDVSLDQSLNPIVWILAGDKTYLCGIEISRSPGMLNMRVRYWLERARDGHDLFIVERAGSGKFVAAHRDLARAKQLAEEHYAEVARTEVWYRGVRMPPCSLDLPCSCELCSPPPCSFRFPGAELRTMHLHRDADLKTLVPRFAAE